MPRLDRKTGKRVHPSAARSHVFEVAEDLIKRFESLHLAPYTDVAGVNTVGWGHTGEAANLRSIISRTRATELLHEDMDRAYRAVVELVKVDLTVSEAAALTSFVFNLGRGSFYGSTLLKRLNDGDVDAAAEEFQRWVYAGGERQAGLIRRRAAEEQLFRAKDVRTAATLHAGDTVDFLNGVLVADQEVDLVMPLPAAVAALRVEPMMLDLDRSDTREA